MKHLPATATLAAAAMIASSGSAAEFPNRVHYIPHDKVSAAMVKGARVIEDAGLTVIANRGVQRGAEIHDTTNHVFIIVDGEAEFVTVGKMIDPKVISPGQ